MHAVTLPRVSPRMMEALQHIASWSFPAPRRSAVGFAVYTRRADVPRRHRAHPRSRAVSSALPGWLLLQLVLRGEGRQRLCICELVPAQLRTALWQGSRARVDVTLLGDTKYEAENVPFVQQPVSFLLITYLYWYTYMCLHCNVHLNPRRCATTV